MKNLVKKTKRKSWMILPIALITGTILTYSLFLAMYISLANLMNVNLEDGKIPMELGLINLLYLISFSGGIVLTMLIQEKLWKPIEKKLISNKECRNINHTKLLKKYILLNDLKASTTLLEQYKNAKYKNNNAYYYFCGAYQRQFNNLEYSPLMTF